MMADMMEAGNKGADGGVTVIMRQRERARQRAQAIKGNANGKSPEEIGVLAFLTKPISPDTVREVLTDLLAD